MHGVGFLIKLKVIDSDLERLSPPGLIPLGSPDSSSPESTPSISPPLSPTVPSGGYSKFSFFCPYVDFDRF